MTRSGFPLSRRAFLGLVGTTLALPGCLTDLTGLTKTTPRLVARPREPSREVVPGIQPLGLATPRDGFLYVPEGYDPAVPAPLMVLLHGSGDGTGFWLSATLDIRTLADARGLVLLAVESRGVSWDIVQNNRFDEDPRFIDEALAVTFNQCRIDPARVGLAGFSDGGTTTLSLGLPNGDLFTQLAAFSPGFIAETDRVGKPGIFLSHGLSDGVFKVTSSRNGLVPKLRGWGYEVEYVEFQGFHEVPQAQLIRAMDRLVAQG